MQEHEACGETCVEPMWHHFQDLISKWVKLSCTQILKLFVWNKIKIGCFKKVRGWEAPNPKINGEPLFMAYIFKEENIGNGGWGKLAL